MKKLLEDLLKQFYETTELDFKREIRLFTYRDKMEFAKDVSAFANTKGGHIVFGKEDPKQGGRIVGIEKDTFNYEQMQQIISKRCNPPVTFEAELIHLKSKWFVILTIPNSAIKPHEIGGTRDVWIRKGSITEKASAQEIIRMRDEAKRLLETKGKPEIEFQPPEKKPLAALEETTMTVTIFSLLILCYFPVRLVTFWALGKGLGIANWLSFEAIAYTVVLAAIIILAPKLILGENYNETIIRLLRKVSIPYIFYFLIFVLAIVIFNLMISLYPVSARVFFQSIWQDFLVVCAFSLIVASITVVLSYFPIAQYLAKLEDPKYMPNPAKEIKQLIHDWKQRMKLFRNKFPSSLMLGLLLVTIAIVPVDIATGLFIPSYHEEGESFSHFYYSVSDVIYLFIYSERIDPNTIGTECRFYRLAQSEYTVYPAKLPLLNTIRIPNPTNITIGSKNHPAITAISSDRSVKSLGDVYVAIDTLGDADYSFVPLTYNFTHIEFEFAKVSEPFVANISYWKLLENVNISVTTLTPQYTDLGNSTWLEKYTFMIVNNEEVPLQTLALDFIRFMYSVVNTTTTKVYSQGREWGLADFVFENRRLGIWLTIGPRLTLNLTITFQSSDIG